MGFPRHIGVSDEARTALSSRPGIPHGNVSLAQEVEGLGMRGEIVVLIAWLLVAVVEAADPLPPGIHKGLTSTDGAYRFTVIVPQAGGGKDMLPAILILPSGFSGLLDPYPWQGLAERRKCYVVALDDGRVREKGSVTPITDALMVADLAHVTAALAAVEARVPLHPYLRIAVGDRLNSQLAVRFAAQQQQNLAGLLLTRPWTMSQALSKTIPVHVPVFLLVGEHDVNSHLSFERLRDDLRTNGVITRSATVLGGKADDWVPQGGCDIAVDHLLDFALVNHPRWSPDKRSANMDAVLARGEGLMSLEDLPCKEQLGFLLSVPGIDQEIKPALVPLTNRWIVAQMNLAKAHPDSEIAEAHWDLSVLAKRPPFKRADREHQKLVHDELKRLRKDKRIKAEIAAADTLVDTLNLLEHDFSIAKQRIALKTLEDLVAKHPATQAGREAAKLLEPLRRNLR